MTMATTMMTADGRSRDAGDETTAASGTNWREEEGPVEEEGYRGVAQFGANGKNEMRRARVE